MIELRNASFSYGGAATVRDLSFSVDKGEFVAILGPNGAGKTTTARLIDGLLKPTTGAVLIDGVETSRSRVSDRARKVGFLFQNPDRQICHNTVREEIAFGLETVRRDLGLEGIAARVDQLLADFGFSGREEPFSLSRGQRQRVALASVLAIQPEVVILDEPTTGLDYLECCQIMDLIRRMNQEQGMTVLMVCHDMEVVLDYATRALVIVDGQLLADGPIPGLFRNQDLLSRASLLPPQIIGLSLRLGSPFDGVTTAEEAADTVLSLRASREVIV